jgi:hypothetical protein
MTGQIRLSPEQNWMPVQAQEILSSQGFIWRAIDILLNGGDGNPAIPTCHHG